MVPYAIALAHIEVRPQLNGSAQSARPLMERSSQSEMGPNFTVISGYVAPTSVYIGGALQNYRARLPTSRATRFGTETRRTALVSSRPHERIAGAMAVGARKKRR